MQQLYFGLLPFFILAWLLTFIASRKNKTSKQVKITAFTAVFTLTVTALIVVWWAISWFDIIIIATILFWIVSISKLIDQKQDLTYAKSITLRDSRLFFLLLTVLVMLSVLSLNGLLLELELPRLMVVWSIIALISIIYSLNKYKIVRSNQEIKDYPTVTLAIPARNETHALKESLEAALFSDYPKLEILVLDDCSQDKTAAVIRSFAHDGVRFVQGEEPSDSWIGKNQAYKTLLDQASGDLILFCGVDVHLSKDSITQLVTHLKSNNLDMLSVLPERVSQDFQSHILQPMRYYWQMSIPRFLRNYPAAISSCWLVDRTALNKAGGFDSVKSSLTPESFIARTFAKNKKYAYIISDRQLAVSTKKQPSSQVDTAIRTFYPIMRHSYALTLMAVMAICLLVIAPFVGLVFSLIGVANNTNYLLSAVLLTIGHIILIARIAPSAMVSSIITLPLSMILNSALLVISAWQHEFGQVDWKGRNICIPATNVDKSD